MRAIILLVSSLVLVVSVFVAGVALTAYAIKEPDRHHFANMDRPDLWTSRPVAINPAGQGYERIAAIPALASLPPSHGDPQTAVAQTEEAEPAKSSTELASSEPAADDMTIATSTDVSAPQRDALDPAHAEWCYGRYRSYRMEDNSYQPFGGAARQQCQSPWSPMAEDTGESVDPKMDIASGDTSEMPTEQAGLFGNDSRHPASGGLQQTATVGAISVGAHEEWCHGRYRSYRVGDNSYQPFDGGPRRACQSPYG